MLKIPECGIYDAEFSLQKTNHRLTKTIIQTKQQIQLRECLGGCVVHPQCYSVNYNANEWLCEFLQESTKGFKIYLADLVTENGWNHYDTKEKKTVNIH